MENLLTPLQTKSKPGIKEDLLTISASHSQRTKRKTSPIDSPEDALTVLRSKPDLGLLVEVLRWLTIDSRQDHDFTVKRPSPKAAQIIFALVNITVSDYWQILNLKGANGHARERHMLILCLRSVSGIGAVISRLRLLISQFKDSESQKIIPIAAKAQPMYDLIEVLEQILHGEDFIMSIWEDINDCIQMSSLRSLQWKELLSLIASGKLLSIASEASFVLNDTDLSVKDKSWAADGGAFSTWLGGNIQFMNKGLPSDDVEGRRALSQLLSKALNLGYKGRHFSCFPMSRYSHSGCRSDHKGRLFKFDGRR